MIRLLASFGTALLISYVVVSLLISTSLVLLHTTPLNLSEVIDKNVRDISCFDGILECRKPQSFSWTLNDYYLLLRVRIRQDANESEILHKIETTFMTTKNLKLYIQIEKDQVDWMMKI